MPTDPITMSPEQFRDAFPAGCPTRTLMDHVTTKWGVLVMLALAGGTRRWSELLRAVDGISEKMLAQTLRTLAADGFVTRDQKPVVPPHVEYALTDAGREVAALLGPLTQRLYEHATAR